MVTSTAPLAPSRVAAPPRAAWWRRFAIVVTLLQCALGLLFSRWGIRFDGAYDIHRTPLAAAVPFVTALVDQIAALPIAAVTAVVMLRMLGVRAKVRDAVIACGCARLPFVLTSPFVMAFRASEGGVGLASGAQTPPLTAFIAACTLLLALGTMLAMHTDSVRAVSGRRGWALAGTTLSVVVGAEVASKVFIAASG